MSKAKSIYEQHRHDHRRMPTWSIAGPGRKYSTTFIQLFAHSSTSNTPTWSWRSGDLFGENYIYQTTRAWMTQGKEHSCRRHE